MDEGKIVIDGEIKKAVDEMLTKEIFVESLPDYVRISSLTDQLCLSVKDARKALIDFDDFDIKEIEDVDTGILMEIRDLHTNNFNL